MSKVAAEVVELRVWQFLRSEMVEDGTRVGQEDVMI